jgi:hypothetical protein
MSHVRPGEGNPGHRPSRNIRFGSAISAALSLLTLGVALWVVGAFDWTGLYSGRFYWGTVPLLTQLFAAALAGVLARLGPRPRRAGAMLGVSAALLGTSWISWWFAASMWPGGNDGPGLAWVMLVGPLTIAGLLIALGILLLSLIDRFARQRPHGPAPPNARDQR